MKQRNNTWFLWMAALFVILATACGKPLFEKKNGCGCPDKKKMVGY